MVDTSNEFKMLQRVLRNQIGEMELALETVPREVYSNQLMEAMRREEVAMRDGKAVSNEAAASIDNALNSETKKFFTKIAGQNVKRWNALQIKIEQEYERFNQRSRGRSRGGDVNNKCVNDPVDTSLVNSTQSAQSAPSLETMNAVDNKSASQWDNEILRLEKDYNSNWINYEIPNLKAAFS